MGVRASLGRVSDRIGRRRVLVPAMLALTSAVALLSTVRSMPLVVARSSAGSVMDTECYEFAMPDCPRLLWKTLWVFAGASRRDPGCAVNPAACRSGGQFAKFCANY